MPSSSSTVSNQEQVGKVASEVSLAAIVGGTLAGVFVGAAVIGVVVVSIIRRRRRVAPYKENIVDVHSFARRESKVIPSTYYNMPTITTKTKVKKIVPL